MLEVQNVSVFTGNGLPLLRNITFSLGPGEILGLTGESGSGKTTLIKSIMGILPKSCRLVSGKILANNIDLTALTSGEHRKLCGTHLGFVPQSPMTAFDSRIRLGTQITETLRLRLGLSPTTATELARQQLFAVNLSDSTRIMESYPSQLSGGMLQRVAIAILMALQPSYILADEPTSALDTVNRDLLLNLLQNQVSRSGILMISHDIAALKALCKTVMVMENGAITEKGSMEQLLLSPCRKWTKEFAAAYRLPEKEDWLWTEY
ncbi:MAG: Nickel-transporting ATPase [Bacillota bacterium]|jgi:ABC-type glutathione transport system ATPase component|nr:Nickel-transporting ATPase [Bacillota bacterium]